MRVGFLDRELLGRLDVCTFLDIFRSFYCSLLDFLRVVEEC